MYYYSREANKLTTIVNTKTEEITAATVFFVFGLFILIILLSPLNLFYI